jgi:formamidopyrimidine-DNA glycosylase
MPELPDLQVFSRNLNKALKGKTLEKIRVVNGSRLKVNASALNKGLAGRKLLEVYREGKQMRFRFDKDMILGMHLMLHGKLYLAEKNDEPKSIIASLIFDDGTTLHLTDFQGMAQLSLNPEENDAPDALSKKMTASFLKKIMAATRKTVKDVLLDQQLIRGIGNAYADEILWQARISPFSKADKIPPAKVTALATAIKKVLTTAEKNILKHDPDIIAGEIRDFLVIHNAKKKTSPGGKAIKHTAERSRKTYYTDEQELYK